jgi:subtilisin family serine protease
MHLPHLVSSRRPFLFVFLGVLAVSGALRGAAPGPTEETSSWVVEARGQRRDHLTRLGAERWLDRGHSGQGVKVAILDSGFRGYRGHLGTSLPARVQAKSFRLDGNLEARDSQHGILCGEVVHALAPKAELLFANWEPDRPDRFLEAVRWAKQQGARVISCSVIMPNWSDGEGGGSVHEELARILGSGADKDGVLCFASAGNTARRHWSGEFRPDSEGFHQWKVGCRDNPLSPWGDESVAVALSFGKGAKYEALVYEGDRAEPIARSRPAHGGALVRFRPQTGKEYRLRLRLAEGKGGRFHCVSLHGEVEIASRAGSVCFPADGAAVVAVGASSFAGERLGYSSCGPNSLCPKPDVVAPVPFSSLWRPRPFGGTSAAAPQAAALAALWWSRYPESNARQVRRALTTAARPVAGTGHSLETGYGVIRLP